MILLILDNLEGVLKKSSYEAASFAAQLGQITGNKITGFVSKNVQDLSTLEKFGVHHLVQYDENEFMDSQIWTSIVSQAFEQLNAAYVVLSNNSLGKLISGRIAVKLNIGLISNVVSMKSENGKLIFKKNVFSGKASAWISFPDNKGGVIAVMPNGYGIIEQSPMKPEMISLNINIPESKTTFKVRRLIKGKVPLTEADVVVSAGRGLKDPSNWPMIEQLADILNANLACSRPVADIGWRPHHEHVGQTGIAIRPNVYIAIGISGAIQHLAGVNNSKKIVVINKDPEAPFFKAADYGICGDLFEIVPKLNDALSKAKA